MVSISESTQYDNRHIWCYFNVNRRSYINNGNNMPTIACMYIHVDLACSLLFGPQNVRLWSNDRGQLAFIVCQWLMAAAILIDHVD